MNVLRCGAAQLVMSRVLCEHSGDFLTTRPSACALESRNMNAYSCSPRHCDHLASRRGPASAGVFMLAIEPGECRRRRPKQEPLKRRWPPASRPARRAVFGEQRRHRAGFNRICGGRRPRAASNRQPDGESALVTALRNVVRCTCSPRHRWLQAAGSRGRAGPRRPRRRDQLPRGSAWSLAGASSQRRVWHMKQPRNESGMGATFMVDNRLLCSDMLAFK